MFFGLDPLAQALDRIVRPHLDPSLGKNGAGIDVVGHDMDRAAGLGDAGLERHRHRVHGPREFGQQ